jgi:hypothetical protein
MDLANVMQAIADRLSTIDGLTCFGYPPAKVTPPAAWVDYPDLIKFDETYGRGMDTMPLMVVVVLGRVSDQSVRDQMGAYANGSGVSSIKQVLETGTYTAFDLVSVTGVDFDFVTLAGINYLSGVFNLAIAGKGTS